MIYAPAHHRSRQSEFPVEDLLSVVVFDLEVFEGDADLLLFAGHEVVHAGGVVGVVARVSRRVEGAVHAAGAAVYEVTPTAVVRRRRRPGYRVVCTVPN